MIFRRTRTSQPPRGALLALLDDLVVVHGGPDVRFFGVLEFDAVGFAVVLDLQDLAGLPSVVDQGVDAVGDLEAEVRPMRVVLDGEDAVRGEAHEVVLPDVGRGRGRVMRGGGNDSI